MRKKYHKSVEITQRYMGTIKKGMKQLRTYKNVKTCTDWWNLKSKDGLTVNK